MQKLGQQDRSVYVSDVPDESWPTGVDQRRTHTEASMRRVLEEALGDVEFDLDVEDETVPEQVETAKVPPKYGKGAATKEPPSKRQKKDDSRPAKSVRIDEGGSRQKETVDVLDDDDETLERRMRCRAAPKTQEKPTPLVPRFERVRPGESLGGADKGVARSAPRHDEQGSFGRLRQFRARRWRSEL